MNYPSDWLNNIREYPWDMLDGDVVEAIQRWIDRDADHRQLELFVTLVNDSAPDEGPWVASNHYMSTARRLPSDAVINGLIGLAMKERRGRERKRLFKIASYAARSESHWPKWRDKIVSLLEQEGGFKGFIKSLLSDPNARWKKREAKQRAKEEEATVNSRRENIAALTPKLDAIASGSPMVFGVLKWAASHYRNARIRKDRPPLENVIKYANEEIAAAIAEGFVQFASHADLKVGVEDLGKAEAKNGAYPQEHVVAAGLHQALLHGRETDLAACPLIIALVGLRQSYFSHDEDPSIAAWAVGRLARDADQGADLILGYWNAALDAGDEDLDALHHLTGAGKPELVSKSLTRLLGARPNLPEQALTQALSACADTLSTRELSELVRRTIGRDDLENKQRDLWNFAALALMPDLAKQLSEREQEAALLAPNAHLAKAFDGLCPELDLLDCMRVGVLGKKHPASDDDWLRSDSVSGIVRAAIRRLGASKSIDAGEQLRHLLDKSMQAGSPRSLILPLNTLAKTAMSNSPHLPSASSLTRLMMALR